MIFHSDVPVSANEEICTTAPAAPEIGLNEAVAAYKKGKLEEALQIYRHLSEGSNDPGIAGISSFMSGYIMGELMIDGGEDYLERAYDMYPLLGDYAWFRLAGIYENTGEYDRAADLYKRIYQSYPESVLQKKSLLKAADSYLAAGKTEEAKNAYDVFIAVYPKDRSIPSALYGLGRCYLSEGKPSPAMDYFRKLWVDYPAHPLSWPAKEEINRLRGEGYELPTLTPADTYTRAEKLYEASLYSDALTEYKRVLSQGDSIASAREKDASFKIGMVNYHLRRSEEAEEAFESFLKHHPGHSMAPEALYWLGRTYLRQGKEDAFIRASKGYLKRYKDKGKSPEVLYRLGNLYAEKRKIETASSYYERVMKEFPQSSYASDSRWAKGWLFYKERRLKEALRVFDQIREFQDAPRVLYWKARTLELMNDPVGMESNLCQLCSQYGGSFYCLFARHFYNIHCVSPIEAEGVEIADDRPEDYETGITGDDQDVRIKLFFLLGLKEEAVEEVQWERKRMKQDEQRAMTLASMLNELGEYNLALSILYSGLSRDLLQNGRRMDGRAQRLMYPEGYREWITRYAGEYGVDPFLIFALIREESWFNEHAVSGAGAVGLMQLMPYTAASILNDPDLKRETLFNPDRNIYLGIRFFSDMLKRFDGNMILAVASYNAGPRAVEKWLRERDGFGLDEFIEDIPYRETREYVKKVFKSYMEYLRMTEFPPVTSPPYRGGDKGKVRG